MCKQISDASKSTTARQNTDFLKFSSSQFLGENLEGEEGSDFRALCHSAFVSQVKWQLTDPPSQYHSRRRRRCHPPPPSPPPSPPPPPSEAAVHRTSLSISQTIAASL